MDVDLSTDLNALLPLVAPLLSGHSDLAIGTRLARGSRVIRGPKRELISRGYNLLLRTLMGARFSDAQCGFKAIRRDQARALLPLTTDTGWFFDTELLVLAERAGLRIHEVPVDWIDDLDSRVDIIATALADLRGMARLGAGFARGSIQVPQLRAPGWAGGRAARGLPLQVARFTVIGVASTIAYVALFLLLRLAMPAQAANVISLLLTAVANTAANRRLTFGISGRSNAARHQVKGLIAFGLGLALTSGSLAMLGQRRPADRDLRAARGQPGRHRHQVPAVPVLGVRPRGAPAGRLAARPPRDRHRPPKRNGYSGRANQLSATTSIPIPRHAGRTRPGRAGRLLRGPQADPRWARPALLGLLALTALLYLWDLGRNGWANDFYAAAVQAGTKSWKAFFFGSFDQSSFITVDKTPGSLWVMELSGRIFGFSQWSMLAPQALEGVGSVLLLYAAVKRWFGPAAGLDRRAGAGAHPGGGADVPVQQPGRAARAADDRGGLHAGPRGRERADQVAGVHRPADRVRVPGQDAAGVPGGAGVRRRLPVGRTAPAGQADLADAADGSRHRRRRGLVDPGRAAHPGGGPALLRRLDHQQHPAARHRLQRPGPADRRRDRLRRPGRAWAAVAGREPRSAGRPAYSGCSTPSSAGRSAGCCPRR